jgi:hypothetical protein
MYSHFLLPTNNLLIGTFLLLLLAGNNYIPAQQPGRSCFTQEEKVIAC